MSTGKAPTRRLDGDGCCFCALAGERQCVGVDEDCGSTGFYAAFEDESKWNAAELGVKHFGFVRLGINLAFVYNDACKVPVFVPT
jgi:hypothetical protein